MPSSHGTVEEEPYAHHAWIDESIVYGTINRYILAAVIAESSACESMRSELESLRLGRRPRLHWYEESPKKRDEVVAAIGGFDIAAVVVVGSPVDHKRQERARRLCMKCILHRLDELEVSGVVLEKRTESLDRRDLTLIDALRGSIGISAQLRVTTADPVGDPMLWIADAIAGSVNASLRGEPDWFHVVERLVERIDIAIS